MRDVVITTRLIRLPLLANLCNITPRLLADAAAEGKLRCQKVQGGHTGVGKLAAGEILATEEDLWTYVASLNPGHPAYKRAVKIGKIGRCLVCRNVGPIVNPGKALCRTCYERDTPEEKGQDMASNRTKLTLEEACTITLEELRRRNGDGMQRSEISSHIGAYRMPPGMTGQILHTLQAANQIENKPRRGDGAWEHRMIDVWHAVKPVEEPTVDDKSLLEMKQSDVDTMGTLKALQAFVPDPPPSPPQATVIPRVVNRSNPTLQGALATLGDVIQALQGPPPDTSALEARIRALEGKLADRPRSDVGERLDLMQVRIDGLYEMMEQTVQPLLQRSLGLAKEPPVTQAAFQAVRSHLHEVQESLEGLRRELGA